MVTRYKVGVLEVDGVDLEYMEERSLTSANVSYDEVSTDSIKDRLDAMTSIGSSNTLILSRKSKTKDAWLELSRDIPTHESAWTPKEEIHLTSLMYTNKKTDSSIVTVTCYSILYNTTNDVGTGDILEFTVNNTDAGAVIGDSNRRFIIDITSNNIILDKTKRYAFRITSDKDVEKVVIELGYTKNVT